MIQAPICKFQHQRERYHEQGETSDSYFQALDGDRDTLQLILERLERTSNAGDSYFQTDADLHCICLCILKPMRWPSGCK